MPEIIFFHPVTLSLAIIVFIESFIWGVLSFLCVLCYLDVIKYDSTENYGLNKFIDNLYNLYLSGETFDSNTRAIVPSTFNVLMWIYFIISLILFFSSGIQIVVLCTKSKLRKINFSTIIWLILVYVLCLYDLITCILFSIDYHLLKNSITTNTAETEVALAVVITFVILTAKGFVLWILNLTLAIIISNLFRKKVVNEPIWKVDPIIHAHNNAAYNAYGDTSTEENPTSDTREEGEQTTTDIQNDSFLARISMDENRENNIRPTSMYSTNDLYENPALSNTWSGRISRVRTNSYVPPRSLVASLTPSPIPPAAIDEDRFNSVNDNDINNSYTYVANDNYQNKTDNKSVYDGDDDDDDYIMYSPSYLSSAYPSVQRFTLKEPEPDYM